jgi:hypothetical protein
MNCPKCRRHLRCYYCQHTLKPEELPNPPLAASVEERLRQYAFAVEIGPHGGAARQVIAVVDLLKYFPELLWTECLKGETE